MQRIFAILLAFLVSASIFAQKTVKVEAEYTYIAPENVTLEQAKLTAFDRAKIQAIADQFGTIVSQSNSTYVENHNGNSNINFQSVGGSDVRGEWIETIGDPEYTISYEQNMLVVKVRVKGRIREITTSQIDLITQILCNGTTPQFERSEFRSGDQLYLRFQSPIDGYLVVYLVDHTAQMAYCLLPYSRSMDSVQKIEHDKPYLFFSSMDVPAGFRDVVDEYTMTCSGTMEQNDLYVVFSPNEFIKASSHRLEESRPRELSKKAFEGWLSKIRTGNTYLQIINKLLTIKN